MNKAELIDVLVEKHDSDPRQASAAVEHIVDTIVRAVHRGETVRISGFGVFEQRRRRARVGRNPRTGEAVKVKARTVPVFRPGAHFKAVVSGAQRLAAGGPAVKRGAVQPTKKSASKKAVAKKAPTRKAQPAKVAKKATAAKKAPAKKAVTRKASAKKTTAKN